MKWDIKDIVKNELCTGCGSCVSVSKNGKMIWNENGFLVPDLNADFSEQAIDLCPFNPQPSKEVENEDVLAEHFLCQTDKSDKKVGCYLNTYVGFVPNYRETSSSGGIATFVFEQLLARKIVDHLFIVKEKNGSYEYQWFDELEQIKESSKTRYIPVTLEKLFKEIENKPGKVAVSGVACFVKAIRLKQFYSPEFNEKIGFVVGIICGGLKSRFFTDYLAQKAGIQGEYSKQEYRIKDPNSTASDYSFGAYDTQKHLRQIKMRGVGDMWGTGLFKSHACDFCDDVATELADISLGDAWINPYREEGMGNSVIMTRTPLADEIIANGIEKGDLNSEEISVELFKKSQDGSFRHRQMGMNYRLHILKRKTNITFSKRKKYYEKIPFEFQRVQKQRMKLRKASLDIWRENPNAEKFEKKILVEKMNLSQATRFYHRMQKLRRMLKLKTL